MRMGQRGRGGAPAGLAVKPGHNRFMWDYRWANGGPLAAPGTYTVKLLLGDGRGRLQPAQGAPQPAQGAPAEGALPPVQSHTFEIKVDPGVIKDGTTVADLVAQGRQVRAVDVKPLDSWHRRSPAAEAMVLDLTDADACRWAADGADPMSLG